MTPGSVVDTRGIRIGVHRRFGAPFSMEEVPVPQMLELSSLLVQSDCCTICGTDAHFANRSVVRKVDLPVIAGHEMTVRVVTKSASTPIGPDGEVDWRKVYDEEVSSFMILRC